MDDRVAPGQPTVGGPAGHHVHDAAAGEVQAQNQEVSHTPCRASKATDGSLTEKNGPVGLDAVVVAGKKPCVQVAPPS
jgi:hypothetical protein